MTKTQVEGQHPVSTAAALFRRLDRIAPARAALRVW